MSHPRHEDWQLLDLAPGADLAEANRALRFRRSLYQPGSLATYNLLDEEEREHMLERIDEAFRRITGCEPPPDFPPQTTSGSIEEQTEAHAGPPPDPKTEPGAFLRHRRLSRGQSLDQLATETKIRAQLLDQLESEAVDQLPAAVFVRGHVLQYAKALELAGANELAARYLAKVKLD